MADTAGLHRRPGRKPPANVSGTDRDYIWAMIEAVGKRRKLSHVTAEKYIQIFTRWQRTWAREANRPKKLMTTR